MRVYKYKSRHSKTEDQPDETGLIGKRDRDESERQNLFLRPNRSRQWFGTRIGLLAGLGFGFTSELMNVYLVQDVNLSAPPLGALGNFMLYGILGALLGWLISLPERFVPGISIGLLTCFGIIEARSWVMPEGTPILSLITRADFRIFSLVSLLIVALMIIPIMWLWRVAIDNLFRSQLKSWWKWSKNRLPLGIIALAVVAGTFFIYPPETRIILQGMDNLVQSGLLVNYENQLPAPLSDPSTKEILFYKEKKYYLQIIRTEKGDWQPSLGSVFGRASRNSPVSIAAHFQGGWSLICTYRSPSDLPSCQAMKK